jgi:hypothetical protein
MNMLSTEPKRKVSRVKASDPPNPKAAKPSSRARGTNGRKKTRVIKSREQKSGNQEAAENQVKSVASQEGRDAIIQEKSSAHEHSDPLHSSIAHLGRQLYDLQQFRIQTSNKIFAMLEKDHLSPEHADHLNEMAEQIHVFEKQVDRLLVKKMKEHPLRKTVEAMPGIGLPGLGRLLAAIHPIESYRTVSSLWKYLGMDVRDGKAPKRRKGEKAKWSHRGRMVCYQLSDCIVKVGKGKYRELYDIKKAEYLSRERSGASNCPFGQVHLNSEGKAIKCELGHAHNAAKRYAIKMAIKDLWVAARKAAPRSRPI